MFRPAATSAYDEVIAKATNENNTSEDWGAIIEVCDKVTNDANGAKEAIQSIIKRLAHRNANVQLYTLELANALSQNCGKPIHRELASRAFTDALLKLANDRNSHQHVKSKILERMKDWSDMFNQDPDLGLMYDAYYRLKQSNPTLHAPSAPQKTGLTDLDRQKEEDELQMALKLSLQDEERKKSVSNAPGPSSAGAGPSTAAEPVVAHPTGTTAATVSRVRALYDFVPTEPGELEFKRGDVIAVLESVYKDWWRGSLKGKTGIFPLNYVEKLTDPTRDELQREAQMEAEVFAEIKNVEKLLTLLSTSNTAPREEDDGEISKLYHQTLSVRPKLIKLIEKYSQKKDDFTQLNEKFIKARRDYESLLEQSMSQPPQHSYHHGYAPQSHAPQGMPQGIPQGIPQGYHLPGAPSGPSGPGPGYAPQVQPVGQQEPQRYYTPGPQGPPPQEQYQASSPPPNNFHRQTPAPAPFYLHGAEVPPPGPPAPQQQQTYPHREQQPSRMANTATTPAPIKTTMSPPPPQPQQNFQAYAPPQSNLRPQSTYGNPQELATSAFDSPVAAHHPGGGPQEEYPTYSQDETHLHSPGGGNPSAPSYGPPQPPQGATAPPGYAPQQPSAPAPQTQLQYTAFNPAAQQGTYEGPAAQAPPQPTSPAPPVPQGVMSPPPLQPNGPALDARQSLPSQALGRPSQPSQPSYRAYVPGGGAPSAAGIGPQGGPSEPSAPHDFYRQGTTY
ncbi:signal transducing adaptor molecule [Microdochium nivale]|nr:signal transducing adaptor molecule [Microdochium nivale]